jgi:hypothetical protein
MNRDKFLIINLLLYLIFCLSSIETVGQVVKGDTLVLHSKKGVGEIELGKRLKKKYLKEFDNFTAYKFPYPEGNPRRTGKIYKINDSRIMISTMKRGYFGSYKIKIISVKMPYFAKTEKNIILGNSTKEDVLNTYGEPNFESETNIAYNFIGFTFENSKVVEISIWGVR